MHTLTLASEVRQNRKIFAEPSSAVISALDESFDDDDIDWHVDINIVLSANKIRS